MVSILSLDLNFILIRVKENTHPSHASRGHAATAPPTSCPGERLPVAALPSPRRLHPSGPPFTVAGDGAAAARPLWLCLQTGGALAQNEFPRLLFLALSALPGKATCPGLGARSAHEAGMAAQPLPQARPGHV